MDRWTETTKTVTAAEQSVTVPIDLLSLTQLVPRLDERATTATQAIPRSIEEFSQRAAKWLTPLLLRPGDRQQQAERNWTIVFNLTTDFGDGDGVENRLKQLKTFATMTTDTDLKVVVQAAIAIKGKDGKPTAHTIERYRIEHGKVEKFEEVPSAGYDRDLESLMSVAAKSSAGRKLGLIIDTHGLGNEGLKGDTGKISLNQFNQAVRKGLGNDSPKLDFLNFDGCFMGQNGVIKSVRNVSSEIVASSEIEDNVGQDIIGPLEKLARNPKMNASDLADLYVESARAKDKQEFHQIHSLAHYHGDSYPKFQSALDNLGDQLIEVVKDPQQKRELERIIDASFFFDPQNATFGIDTADTVKFDLKDFVSRMKKAIAQGELKDPNGTLKQSADQVLTDMAVLVKSYYGHGSYKNNGGISVFLPTSWMRDAEKTARTMTAAGRLEQLARETVDSPRSTNLIKRLGEQVRAIGEDNAINATDENKQLLKAVQSSFEMLASNQASYERAKECATRLLTAVQLVTRTSDCQLQQRRKIEEVRRNIDRSLKKELVENDGGWGRFRLKLAGR